MTFRSKLLVVSAATVIAAVGLDSLIVEETTRSAFERLDSQRTSALVAQLRREYERRQEEVMRRTERIAASEALQRMALEETTPPTSMKRAHRPTRRDWISSS
jgi:glutamyl-tRNA reductase